VLLTIANPAAYEGEPTEGQIRLRDHLLDKKVLDFADDEVEVVYDIKLTAHNGVRALPIVGKGNIVKGAIPYRDIM
jgi:hypothetical protein